MSKYRFTFPGKGLSPNDRGHWAKRSRCKADYKELISMECKEQKIPKTMSAPISVGVTFQVPDKRKRDDDNMIAAFKAGRDAIAEHIGVDDASWQVEYRVDRAPIARGAVWVEFFEGRI